MAFSPDGNHLVSGSFDDTLRLWNTDTWESPRTCQAQTACSRQWLSPLMDGISSPGCQIPLSKFGIWPSVRICVFEGHKSKINTVLFSPDGRKIISASNDTTLRLWDLATGAGHVLGNHDGGVHAVSFFPNGRHVISASSDRSLRLWDTLLTSSPGLARLDGDGRLDSPTLSPNGKFLIAGDALGRVHLIDILIDNPDKAAWLRKH